MSLALLLLILLIILLIGCSAFFSGSETALTAASRARMHTISKNSEKNTEKNKQATRADLVTELLARRDRLIGALLLGNNMVNILASALATSVFITLFGESGVLIATLVMTIVVVIFAEVLPKSWAISNPDNFALSVAPIINVIVKIFGPLVSVINAIVRWVLARFGLKLDEDGSMLSAHDELRGTVEVLHRDGSFVKDDRDRLGGVLDLHELEISDVMVHRTNMETINLEDKPEDIINQVLKSPYSRLAIWKDNFDNILGVIHVKDLLRAMATKDNDPAKVDILKIAAKPWYVPETTSLKDQLNAFLRKKAHFALVVDEYGEVEGMVTLEDILEEIVGEIADEHDEELQGVSLEPDGSVVVEGSTSIRDLNRALDWELPDEEATTIAGLVIHETQMIPDEKQAFTFYGKRFVVLKRERNRITQLRVRALKGAS
jgi:Mg2+/Co2+ transporter CorB